MSCKFGVHDSGASPDSLQLAAAEMDHPHAGVEYSTLSR